MTRATIIVGALCLSLFSAGCGDEAAAPIADLQLLVVSGDGQVGRCYAELPLPVLVEVRDDRGVPVAGHTVDFRVVEGGGSAREGTALSDGRGRAFDHWTLGAAGSQTLEARALGAGGAFAAVARFTATAEEGEVGGRRITTEAARPFGGSTPAISGDRVVWMDYRNERPATRPGFTLSADIYLYDLSAQTEQRITTNGSDPFHPAIAGDRIVWHDHRNGDEDIYLYDLATQTERRITTDTADQFTPDVDGNRIVWVDQRHGGWDIYLFDVATETEQRITTALSSVHHHPAISGERIVWEGVADTIYGVQLYDLATQTQRLLPGGPVGQDPDIDGNQIVWTERTGLDVDAYINLYDLDTEMLRRVATGNIITRPAVSGDRIVWARRRDGFDGDVYLYDLATATERRLPRYAPDQFNPDISADRIVWYGAGAVGHIYLYDLRICSPPGD